MKQLTIYEIAKLAQVSPATVSRVINNYHYVNKETRARVLKVMSEHNFECYMTPKGPVVQSTKIVGILIADIRTTHHTEGVYFIEKELSKNGYSCIIYNTGNDPIQQEKHIQLLSQKEVEAVALMGSIYQNIHVQNAIMVNMPNTPVAICNGYLDGPNIYGVITDEIKGVQDAVKLLADKGHRNLVFITNRFTPSNRNKLEGFNKGLELYVKHGKTTVVEVGESVEDMQTAIRKLMKEKPDTDAIVFSEDFLAISGMHALFELGIRIPEDVAVVGVNNSRYAEISNPSLTSVDNLLYDISLIAVRNLIATLKGEHANRRIFVYPEVVERDST